MPKPTPDAVVHAGKPGGERAGGVPRQSLKVQRVLFEIALDQLAGDEPVNEVIEITLTADRKLRVDRYAWSGDHYPGI